MENSKSNKDKIIFVKKASGEQEPFSSEKLERSLHNAGAKKEIISIIIADIMSWIYPGVSTKKIYHRAFSLLHEEKNGSSIRYRLKQAILELGPTGYPFEILTGELFKKLGYDIEVGVEVEGKCVSHEMDVIATKDKVQHLVECKYHKDQGKHVSVQVPLYVRSRVNDIISKRKTMLMYQNFDFKGWVVTNTSFSLDSIQYGNCANLNLLAWNYPVGDGLKENIEKYKLYPVTVLKKLNAKEKAFILERGVVTCPQLLEKKEILKELNLGKTKYNNVLNELKEII